MISEHHMKLSAKPFDDIISGRKVIESRLFDEKRQLISIGDTIVFTKNDTSEKASVIVKGLIRYQTFKDLFTDLDPSLFGENDRDHLLKQIRQFYSDEDEKMYGVIGIRLELLSKS